MLFNSFEFVVFFIVVTLLYFNLPYKVRWAFLLAASCFFYMFFMPIYIFILFFTIFIDYFAGIWIEGQHDPKKRKLYLGLSIAANIGVLAIFKYYNFLNGNISGLLELFGVHNPIPYLNILLPIGLSFHTFQAMSYTLEVYRGNQKAERNFGIYALYVMFYPQLVAGPIERPQNIIYQFYEKHDFDYEMVSSGLRLMLWGLIKKIVIADRLAIYVNAVYSNLHAYHGFPILWAVLFFAVQVYCDFSGYSDIAIGAARVMGFRLMINFTYPLLSRNLTELWRTWHISLTSWFADYLYKPFVTEHRDWGKTAVVAGIMMTFLLSGLWHGASWTFVIFGAVNGIGLVYDVLTQKQRKKVSRKIPSYIYNPVSIVLTIFYFSFCTIFFRSKDFHDAWYVISHIFLFDRNIIGVPVFTQVSFLLCFAVIAFSFIADYILKEGLFAEQLGKRSVKYALNFMGLVLLLMFAIFEQQSFVYFQF